MVLAPWAAGGDTTVSGLRMDKFGNIGIGTPTNNGFILAVNRDITINGKINCKNESNQWVKNYEEIYIKIFILNA